MTTAVLTNVLLTLLVTVLVLYLVKLMRLRGRARQVVPAVIIVLCVLSLLKAIALF